MGGGRSKYTRNVHPTTVIKDDGREGEGVQVGQLIHRYRISSECIQLKSNPTYIL